MSVAQKLQVEALRATMILVREAVKKGRIDISRLGDAHEDIEDIVHDLYAEAVLPVLPDFEERAESTLTTFLRTRVNSRLDRVVRGYTDHGLTHVGDARVQHEPLPEAEQGDEDTAPSPELAYDSPPAGLEDPETSQTIAYPVEAVLEAIRRLEPHHSELVSLYASGGVTYAKARWAIRALRDLLRREIASG